MRSAPAPGLIARLLSFDRAVLSVVFLALAAPHLLALRGGGMRVFSGDEPHYLLQITSLLEHGELDLSGAYAEVHRGGAGAGARFAGTALDHHTVWFSGDERRTWAPVGDRDGTGHPEYPTHPIGLALALAPLLYPLRGTAALEPAALLCTLLATLAAVLFFRWLLDGFTIDPRRRNAATIVAFLATPVWPYARTLYTEPYLLLCAVAAYALALRRGRGLLAGGFIAWGILMKPTFALLLLPLLVGFARRRDLRAAAALVLLPTLAVAATLALDARFFGAPFRPAQAFSAGNPLAGLLGILFSPAHGLLPTAPVLLLAAVGWPRLLRAQPDALLIAAAAALQVGLTAVWWCWWAGYCYGPRLVVPVVPFLVIPLVAVEVPARLSARAARAGRLVAGGLVAVSLAINLLAALSCGLSWGHHPFAAVVKRLF